MLSQLREVTDYLDTWFWALPEWLWLFPVCPEAGAGSCLKEKHINERRKKRTGRRRTGYVLKGPAQMDEVPRRLCHRHLSKDTGALCLQKSPSKSNKPRRPDRVLSGQHRASSTVFAQSLVLTSPNVVREDLKIPRKYAHRNIHVKPQSFSKALKLLFSKKPLTYFQVSTALGII